MGEPERRRRRLRPPSSGASAAPAVGDETAGPATPAIVTVPIADPEDTVRRPVEPAAPATEQRPVAADRPGRPARPGYGGRRPSGPAGDDREVERGLRGLVGSGSSQVSVTAALRARDAARPSEQDLADADRDLTIVRRNWVPREDLPRNR